jgi:hypothetical protein
MKVIGRPPVVAETLTKKGNAFRSMIRLTKSKRTLNCVRDGQQLDPMVKQIRTITRHPPHELSAAAGNCSEGNLAVRAHHHVDSYIATGHRRE